MQNFGNTIKPLKSIFGLNCGVKSSLSEFKRKREK